MQTSQREAFSDAWEALKSVFGRGSVPDPAGELTNHRLPSQLGGTPHRHFLSPSMSRLSAFGASDLDAFGVWTSAPSAPQNLFSTPTLAPFPAVPSGSAPVGDKLLYRNSVRLCFILQRTKCSGTKQPAASSAGHWAMPAPEANKMPMSTIGL